MRRGPWWSFYYLVVPESLNSWAAVPVVPTEDLARFGLVPTLAVTSFNLGLTWHWIKGLVCGPSVSGPNSTRVLSYGGIAAQLF